MSTDRGTPAEDSLGADDADLAIEPERTGRQVLTQVARRWKHWTVAAVTAVTTWFLYGISDTWTTDAIAFGLVTVAILGYALATLYMDLELA